MHRKSALYYKYIDEIFNIGRLPQGFLSQSANCLRHTYVAMHAALKTDLSLEVGAREATYSQEMKKEHGDAIAACAIEASPRTHAYFSEHASLEAKGIEYINALISDSEGPAIFYEYIDAGANIADGMSSMYVRDSTKRHNLRKSKTVVRAVRGDTLLKGRYKTKSSVALWLDVEGAQQEVLSSFSRSFAEGIINSVYIEVESERLWPEQKMLDTDILSHMADLGFTPFLRDNEFNGIQYNIIFVNNKLLPLDLGQFYKYYISLLAQISPQVLSLARGL